MKKMFNNPVNLKIHYTIGFVSVYTDIIGIFYSKVGFILIQDIGDFVGFYYADLNEEITLEFKMNEISKIEIV